MVLCQLLYWKGAAAAGVPLGVGATAKALLGAPSLVRAAGIGAISDLISKESDGHNALGTLRDHYGWMDTPLVKKKTILYDEVKKHR